MQDGGRTGGPFDPPFESKWQKGRRTLSPAAVLRNAMPFASWRGSRAKRIRSRACQLVRRSGQPLTHSVAHHAMVKISPSICGWKELQNGGPPKDFAQMIITRPKGTIAGKEDKNKDKKGGISHHFPERGIRFPC